MVEHQETNLKLSFEESKIKIMNHHKLEMFDYLRGKVSHNALDLLSIELSKLKVLRSAKATCGCQLFTSCGLPCACRLAKYENTGTKIPLAAVDVFWTKLDKLNPSLVEGEEEIDVEAEMEHVKQQIMTQSPEVKKSLLSKIFGVVYPGRSVKKPPIVQKDIRGRPTLKMQEQKKQEKQDAARHSSYMVESQHSTFDSPRHSSATQSVVKSQKPAMQRSRSTSSEVKEILDVEFPLIGEANELYIVRRFKGGIPYTFHKYISHIQDVKPDGNCGFRAVAVGLGLHEREWVYVRQQLLQEMDSYEFEYRSVFQMVDPGQFDVVRHTINWNDVAFAPEEHWMLMPYTGIVIAQRFGVIVHLISNQGSQTFFPLWAGPRSNTLHQFVSLVHLPGHFIHVKLEGDYPMPTLNYLWIHRRNEAAAKWEEIYGPRIEQYNAFIASTKTKQYVNFF